MIDSVTGRKSDRVGAVNQMDAKSFHPCMLWENGENKHKHVKVDLTLPLVSLFSLTASRVPLPPLTSTESLRWPSS